jgi:Flp pilus assembly protein TadD
VGVLAFVLYAPTIRYGYVAYDDPWLLRDNQLLRDFSFDAVWRILTDFSWEQRNRLGAEYLPLRDLSVVLDYAIYGDWIGGLHLTQVLLYAGCCALLGTLTLAMFESRPLAWLAAVFFTVHPVHVEAVAWLSERKGVLGAFLAFASLLCATSALRRGGVVRVVLACLLFLLAVSAKAVTIASVGALVLIVLWVESPTSRRKKLALIVAYCAAGLIAFVPYLWVARSFGVVAPDGGGAVESVLWFFQAHTQYLKLMAFGGPYAIDYGIELGSATVWQWLPGALAAVGAAALVAWAVLRRPMRNAMTFGLGWWLVFLAPASHLFATIQNAAADRYVFIPSFGLLLAAAAAVLRLPKTPRWVLSVAIVAVGCVWTLVQMPAWSSSERLFENAVHVVPRSPDAWDKLASLAAERGEPELAWNYTVRGLEHVPGHWRLLHRQGLLLSSRGELDEAIDVMRRAASTPEAHKAYANLALLYLRRGNEGEALDAAEDAVRFQPRVTHNQRVLGVVTYQLGDRQRACRAFEDAYRLDPYGEANIANIALCRLDSDDRTPIEGEE